MTYKFGNAYYRKVYEGNWVDGMREGRGEITWNNEAVNEGDYKNDKMEGSGTLTCAYGAVFVGDFKNDKKEGRGTFTCKEGGWRYIYFPVPMEL
jgi:hypothetical protein